MHIQIDSIYSNESSNYWNEIRNNRMQILTIGKGVEAFKWNFEPFEPNLNIRLQILTIWKGFEAFECKFEPF